MSYICIRYIGEKYYKKDKSSKRYGLAINTKPVLTIFNPKTFINKNSEINSATSPISIPLRSPKKCIYQEGQYESFIS